MWTCLWFEWLLIVFYNSSVSLRVTFAGSLGITLGGIERISKVINKDTIDDGFHMLLRLFYLIFYIYSYEDLAINPNPICIIYLFLILAYNCKNVCTFRRK